MADRGRGQQSAGRGSAGRGPGGMGSQGSSGRGGRGGRGIGAGAPSAGRKGRGVGQQRGGGKDASSKDFRRTAKKTKLTDIDLSPGVAMTAEQKNARAAVAKAKAAAAAAKTAAARAAAEKATKAAAAKKAAADKAARDKAAAAKREAGRGGSSKSKSTGTGGKSPGPRGQRGGTPSPGRSFGRGTGKGQSNTGSRGPGGRGGRSGGRGGRGGGGRGGRGGGRGCFIAETLIQMLDGTTKPIINIQVGEETKGGIVQAKMEFLPDNIYNYKGVEVSGSHWVIEDNQFIEVENSKHGILTDKIETVYCFKTSENRIWVNGIEFGDYESGSYEDWEPHFEQVKEKLNRELLSK